MRIDLFSITYCMISIIIIFIVMYFHRKNEKIIDKMFDDMSGCVIIKEKQFDEIFKKLTFKYLREPTAKILDFNMLPEMKKELVFKPIKENK